jgi:hypothetical protein
MFHVIAVSMDNFIMREGEARCHGLSPISCFEERLFLAATGGIYGRICCPQIQRINSTSKTRQLLAGRSVARAVFFLKKVLTGRLEGLGFQPQSSHSRCLHQQAKGNYLNLIIVQYIYMIHSNLWLVCLPFVLAYFHPL